MSAPTGLTISSETYSGYRASWTNNVAYDSLDVYYRHDGGSYSIEHMGSSPLNYYDVTASEGAAVEFYLYWTYDGPPPAAGYTGSVTGYTVLRAPTATGTSIVGAGEVAVTWTCAAGTETAFDVYYDVSGGSSWSLGRTTGADETDGTVTGLTGGYTYKFKVIARNSYTSSESSNEVTQYVGTVLSDTLTATTTLTATLTEIAGFVDAFAATATLTASESDIAGMSEILTATATLTASTLDASTLKTDFAYYLGDATGGIYEYSPAYLSDNGTSISSLWRSKTLDMMEHGVENSGLWKTLSKVEVVYVDKTVNTPVVVRVSNDGGVTWTTSTTHYCGSGSNRTDSEDFWFIVSGQFFLVETIWASTDKEFQFLGVNVEYDQTGETW